MESHQKNAGGNARIAETMFRYFRFPKDFRQLRLALPGPAGPRDQDRRRLLALAQAPLHGHPLLAAQRHLAGRLLVLASTTAATGSSCTTWRSASSSRSPSPPSPTATALPPHRGQRHRRPVEVDRRGLRRTPRRRSTRPLANAGAEVGTDAAATLTELPLDALDAGRDPRLPLDGPERHGRRRRLRAGPLQGTSTCATRRSRSPPASTAAGSSPASPPRRSPSSSPSRPTAPAASRPTPSRSSPATPPRSPSPRPTATPPPSPSPPATSIRASPRLTPGADR